MNASKDNRTHARRRRARRLGVAAGAIVAFTALLLGPALALVKKDTYSTGDFIGQIPDLDYLEEKIKVPGKGRIRDVDVQVRLAHPFAGDLQLILLAPWGKTIPLSTSNGANQADYGAGEKSCAGDFTTFDDSAETSITAAEPPFVGSFQPEGSLDRLSGRPARGRWRLLIVDGGPNDSGELYCWRLKIKRVIKDRSGKGKGDAKEAQNEGKGNRSHRSDG